MRPLPSPTPSTRRKYRPTGTLAVMEAVRTSSGELLATTEPLASSSSSFAFRLLLTAGPSAPGKSSARSTTPSLEKKVKTSVSKRSEIMPSTLTERGALTKGVASWAPSGSRVDP